MNEGLLLTSPAEILSVACCQFCRLFALFACPDYFPLSTLIPPGKLQKEPPRVLWVFKCF